MMEKDGFDNSAGVPQSPNPEGGLANPNAQGGAGYPHLSNQNQDTGMANPNAWHPLPQPNQEGATNQFDPGFDKPKIL